MNAYTKTIQTGGRRPKTGNKIKEYLTTQDKRNRKKDNKGTNKSLQSFLFIFFDSNITVDRVF